MNTTPRLTIEERFWPKVDQSGGPDACWPWTGGSDTHGYGHTTDFIGDRRVNQKAHRVSYRIASGRAIPAGMQVLHSCDNPPCVNPRHLRLGTVRDNMNDKMARGRNVAPAKLTLEQVAEIRASTEPQKVVAARYGISPSNVSRVRTRDTWRAA